MKRTWLILLPYVLIVVLASGLAVFLLTDMGAATATVFTKLEVSMRGPQVVLLQDCLYRLGYLNGPVDGVFGLTTHRAVSRFQADRGLIVDGIVGQRTWEALRQAVGMVETKTHIVKPGETLWDLARRFGTTVPALAGVNNIEKPRVLRAGVKLMIPAAGTGTTAVSRPLVQLVHWEEARKIYKNFAVATILDLQTGLRFKVRRFYGHYHADTEPLTASDTRIMLQALGGKWSWERRPIVVEVAGYRLVASMNGMPHGRYSIKDNGFSGHFCVHFLGSRLHLDGRMDERHQKAVLRAAGYKGEVAQWLLEE